MGLEGCAEALLGGPAGAPDLNHKAAWSPSPQTVLQVRNVVPWLVCRSCERCWTFSQGSWRIIKDFLNGSDI